MSKPAAKSSEKPAAADAAPASHARLNFMCDMEKQVQARWAQERPYDAEPKEGQEKFFVTFPYPYMNGRLHLGHAFSLSKSEFAARYQRLKGKNVLWPFGLHVTGTPIAACAQKLKNEMIKYGNPPVFPAPPKEEETHADPNAEAPAKAEAKPAAKPAAKKSDAPPGVHKGKRSKVGPAKPQWQIMEAMGIKPEDIPSFADANHWLNYFPPLALEDLKGFGCHIDMRRSFITTEVNPFYDSFVRWQFIHLRNQDHLKFGKRNCVYSPLDGQPCADHDRASGEGVGPQEYTAVLLRVKEPASIEALAPFKQHFEGMEVVLPGATLRPETTCGQTNCWMSPNVTYKGFHVKAKTGTTTRLYIMTQQAARNMAFQDFEVNGKVNYTPEPLFEIKGDKLIGLPLKAPHAPFDTIYTLPMASISEKKGTGVVMSVPSDSPDDYTNLMALVNKKEFREKLNLKDEWVLPFAKHHAIIDCGGDLGTESARVSCEQAKVNGPGDATQLAEAKNIAYNAGFYSGVMIDGPFKGEKVSEAKVKMSRRMADDDDAIIYNEPQKPVMSRSGDECVVAMCDQWFLNYSDAEWEAAVEKHLANMECYFPGIRNGFEETVKWLSQWPCSRNFGLGTSLPFKDAEKVIIDSLSDSTIYMAYYIAAKYTQAAADGSQNLAGTKPNQYGLKPEMFTFDTWEFIYRGVGTADEVSAKTGCPKNILEQMRADFLYFYPVDLRVSGKDLIQNHLTMFLYNHAAIWKGEEDKWPRAVYCNGHIMVDGDKMSKAAGNFVVLSDALKEYSADGTRLAVADAGDSLDDANFVRETAQSFALKLTTLIDTFKDRQSKLSTFRTGEKSTFDKVFENTINDVIAKTDNLYSRMQFRLAFNLIFYELQSEASQYRIATEKDGMHVDVVKRYHEVFPVLLSPLAPHTAEHLWTEVLGHPQSIMKELYPTQSAPVDVSLYFAAKLISDVAADLRSALTRAKKKVAPTEANVFISSDYMDWQKTALAEMKALATANNGTLPADASAQVRAKMGDALDKKLIPDMMAFMAYMGKLAEKHGVQALSTTPMIDDMKVLTEALPHIISQTGIPTIHLRPKTDASTGDKDKVTREKSRPGAPTITFPPAPK